MHRYEYACFLTLALGAWGGDSFTQEVQADAKVNRASDTNHRLELRLLVDAKRSNPEVEQAETFVKDVKSAKDLEAARVPKHCQWIELERNEAVRLKFLREANGEVANEDQATVGFRRSDMPLSEYVTFHLPHEKRHYVLTRIPGATEKITENDLAEMRKEIRFENHVLIISLKSTSQERLSVLTKAGRASVVIVLDRKVIFMAQLIEPLHSEIAVTFGISPVDPSGEKRLNSFLGVAGGVLPKLKKD